MAHHNPKTDFVATLRGSAMIAGLLFGILLLGGASRADAVTQAAVRVVAIVAIAAVFWTPTKSVIAARPVWYFLGAWTLLIAIQLVPLPPAIWSALPGREILSQFYAATRQPLPWHALSLVPDATANALFAMIVVWAAVLIAVTRLGHSPAVAEVTILLFLFVSLAIGVVQFVSGGQSLYFYAITNTGSPVGLFSNRNHNAFMLVLIIPLLSSVLIRSRAGKELTLAALGTLVGVSLVVMINILVIGSRMGVALFGLAVAGSFVLLLPHLPRLKGPGRVPGRRIVLLAGTTAAALIAVVMAMVLLYGDRFLALSRVSQTGLEEERLGYIPSVVDLIHAYFPFGSGFGSFPTVFKIIEPDNLLRLTYLNHAHNDVLEIGVEGGLAAVAIAAMFVVVWGLRVFAVWRRSAKGADAERVNQARVGSIISGILLVGSVTDYPLRTPACAVTFAVACCWLFAAGTRRLSFDANVT